MAGKPLMASAPEAWHEPPLLPTIQENEVHVWLADLDVPARAAGQLAASLGDEESIQAKRFRFPVHRERFIARRGVLRFVLGRYLGIEPAALEFRRSSYGKPCLGDRHDPDLRFNCSHSGSLALIAVTRGREVGVDLERVKPDFSDDSIPESFFAPSEAAMLRALPARQQPEAFFEFWVRKEAYVKARGMGLSLALDSFEVPLGDDEPVISLPAGQDTAEAGRWTMTGLRPAPSHPAALVVEGKACTLRRWKWSLPGRPSGTGQY